ncbi:hypothetical protein BpHYR1_023016 [Brachionus plicatilis]|uniref:Uncharacterized protein n=1 Tax=Brachionus plicatilis TaxID=10195 RepID=A0A3M7QEN8_BRAPC|nr:hypothetical protein BpHYR1_023016 [Brachionus plicatilis]
MSSNSTDSAETTASACTSLGHFDTNHSCTCPLPWNHSAPRLVSNKGLIGFCSCICSFAIEVVVVVTGDKFELVQEDDEEEDKDFGSFPLGPRTQFSHLFCYPDTFCSKSTSPKWSDTKQRTLPAQHKLWTQSPNNFADPACPTPVQSPLLAAEMK